MLLNSPFQRWLSQISSGTRSGSDEETKEGANGHLQHPAVHLTFASLPKVYKGIFGLLVTVIVLLLWTVWSRPYSGGAATGSDSVSRPMHLPQTSLSGSSVTRKAVIIASITRAKTAWFTKIPKDWEQYIYVADDPNAALTVPRNQGREAMPYLTYIIDNYYNLPDYMVFVHAHERGWHQPEPLPYLLQALNLTAVDHHGWVNMRCSLTPSCVPAPKTWVDTSFVPPGRAWWSYLVRGLYSYTYRPGDPWHNASWPLVGGIHIPEYFASPCCAQFAVSKAAVLAKPIEFWTRLRAPLLRDLSEFNKLWWPGLKPKDFSQFVGINPWNIGVGYERLWHFFFGMEPITCLDEDYCKKVIYQDRIRCNGTTTGWKHSQDFMWISCKLFDDLGSSVLAENQVGEGTY